MLVISNRPRASRSSNFKINRAITSLIVLHSVQLLFHIFIKKKTNKNKQRQSNPVSSLGKLFSLTCNPDNCNVSCDSVIEIKLVNH